MPNESLTPFGAVVARLLESGALGPEDAPHPNALGHILEISLTEDGRAHLTAAFEVIAERFDAAMTPPIDVAAAYVSLHDGRFVDEAALLTRIARERDALTEKLAAAERQIHTWRTRATVAQESLGHVEAERAAAVARAEKAEEVVGRGLSLAEERNARSLAVSKLERVRAERDTAVARAGRETALRVDAEKCFDEEEGARVAAEADRRRATHALRAAREWVGSDSDPGPAQAELLKLIDAALASKDGGGP